MFFVFSCCFKRDLALLGALLVESFKEMKVKTILQKSVSYSLSNSGTDFQILGY